jgi:hypothetical protein
VGFKKPVTSPLAFRHLSVVLGEPQLSQSSTAKVVRRIGHLGTSPDFNLRPDSGEPMASKPVRCRQRPPAPRPVQVNRSSVKIAGYLSDPNRKNGIRGEKRLRCGCPSVQEPLTWPTQAGLQGALGRPGRAHDGSGAVLIIETDERKSRDRKPACAWLAAEPKQSPTSNWRCPSSKP